MRHIFCTLSLLIVFALLTACGSDSKPSYDPWAMRVEMQREGNTRPQDKANEKIVRQEIKEIRNVLYQVLNDKKDGTNDARLDYLASKLATIENFEVIFNDTIEGAAISPSVQVLFVDNRIMQKGMRYIRFFALAHELGHLLSVPAYLGVNGLNFYSDQEIEDFNLTSLEDAGRGHRFDEYSLENYPFIDELRNYAAYGTEGLRYIYANPEQRGKILESVQQATTLLVDEGYTLNTLNREEYENFRKDRLLESIYLGNALQTRHAVLEKNLAEDQNWGPIFEQANCYIDEVMADHFAIKAVEKKVQENERANASPDKISPWAWSGYALFYWFKTINGSGWKSDVGKCTDAHLSFNRRLLLIKSSDILKKYITDRTAEEEFGAGAGDGRAL